MFRAVMVVYHTAPIISLQRKYSTTLVHAWRNVFINLNRVTRTRMNRGAPIEAPLSSVGRWQTHHCGRCQEYRSVMRGAEAGDRE